MDFMRSISLLFCMKLFPIEPCQSELDLISDCSWILSSKTNKFQSQLYKSRNELLCWETCASMSLLLASNIDVHLISMMDDIHVDFRHLSSSPPKLCWCHCFLFLALWSCQPFGPPDLWPLLLCWGQEENRVSNVKQHALHFWQFYQNLWYVTFPH